MFVLSRTPIRFSFFAFTWVLLSPPAWADRLAETEGFSHEVRFTNPVCREYRYAEPVRSVGGKLLEAKPKNTYCKPSDASASASREESPQNLLLNWIRDPSTREIFFTYLSFSNSGVGSALCEAIEKRNVKVRFILDSSNLEKPEQMRAAEKLMKCRPRNQDPQSAPEMILRGHEKGLGYAHNKLFLINPSDENSPLKLVFSSGNLTSGVSLHHENWNFISLARNTHFAQAHLCLMKGMLEHGESARSYRAFISSCRASIGKAPEEDYQSFFVPGEGEAATSAIASLVKHTKNILIAAHRFSYQRLVSLLSDRLKSASTSIRLITDDDTYWVGTTGEQVGPNMRMEYKIIKTLEKQGLEVKWMETNHSAFLLHHNKFIVFDRNAVFTGAGNFTGDAFDRNFENFYLIRDQRITQAYLDQYDHLWNELATETQNLPSENLLP